MKTFREWMVIREGIFGYPIEMKWMSLPLPALKKYLQQAIHVLGADGESDAHVEHLKATIRDIIPQMRQRYGLALDSELDMLGALT